MKRLTVGIGVVVLVGLMWAASVHAGYCTTSCYTVGGYTYCNTYCY